MTHMLVTVTTLLAAAMWVPSFAVLQGRSGSMLQMEGTWVGGFESESGWTPIVAVFERAGAELRGEVVLITEGGDRSGWNPPPWTRRKSVSAPHGAIESFAIFGAKDALGSAAESARRGRLALERAGNRKFEIVVIASANHGLWEVPALHGDDMSRARRYAPGYLEKLREWLSQFARR